MADVSKIFKPRRGTKSIMAGTKKSTVLASGELFVEVPDAGVGKGASKIKIGDGTTAYSSLPYALGDTSNDQITFSSNTSTTVAAALNSVTSGGSLKNIVAGLKQAVSLCNTSITQLNDDITSFQTGVDTIYNGCKTYGSTPTASTPAAIVNAIKAIYNNRYTAGYNAGLANVKSYMSINEHKSSMSETYYNIGFKPKVLFIGCNIGAAFAWYTETTGKCYYNANTATGWNVGTWINVSENNLYRICKIDSTGFSFCVGVSTYSNQNLIIFAIG